MLTYPIRFRLFLILLTMTMGFLPSSSGAQNGSQFQVTWDSTATGGTSLGGGEDGYTLRDAIGQPQVAAMTGGDFTLYPGVHSGSVTVPNLVLFYVNADNELHDYVKDLVRRAHAGARQTDGVVLMMLDGPKDNDSRIYRLDGGNLGDCTNIFADYTCGGRYVDDYNVWPFSEDVGTPETLAKFVIDAIQDYPSARQILLSLVGHGGGWSPNRLAGQPKQIGGQPGELGGLLWDFHSAPDTDTGYALSTTDLGDALEMVKTQTNGRTVDLLYLDACLMGMWEVAYEVKDNVGYLLASESWSWTSFQYDEHLQTVTKDATAEQIGQAWLRNETDFLQQNFKTAYTYSLLNLGLMDELSAQIDGLADELIKTLPGSRDQLTAVFTETDRFDSTQDEDYMINGLDNYADLGHLTKVLAGKFPTNAGLIRAGEAVSTTLAAAVVENIAHSGVLPPGYPPSPWTWQQPSGLSIYLPLNPEDNDWKRDYYGQLRSSKEHEWDEFIDAFWAGVDAPSAPACPDPCELPPAPLFIEPTDLEANVYLPLVAR